MQLISNLKARFPGEQFLLVVLGISLALPYQISAFIVVGAFLYLLKSKKVINLYKEVPKAKYLCLFLIVSLLVSIFYRNWVGVATTLGLVVAVTLMLYYRKHINKDVFEYILDFLIFASLFWAMISAYQQWKIIERLNDGVFTLHVYSQRQNRITGVFYNANYYGMMLEFLILAIAYKFTQTHNNTKKSIYYVCMGLLNLFVLYMTGCRTAYIAICGALVIYFIFNKNYKICAGISFVVLAVGALLIMKPQLFPRIVKIVANFGVRVKIWACAIEGIKAHPLFGQGPFTYVLIRELYNGHMTQHAHSVCLDPLLSFGIVGLGILVPYVVDNTKRLLSVYKKHMSYVAFMLSIITIVLLHGIFDYTIFWLHTGLFFMFMMSSYPMFKKGME